MTKRKQEAFNQFVKDKTTDGIPIVTKKDFNTAYRSWCISKGLPYYTCNQTIQWKLQNLGWECAPSCAGYAWWGKKLV